MRTAGLKLAVAPAWRGSGERGPRCRERLLGEWTGERSLHSARSGWVSPDEGTPAVARCEPPGAPPSGPAPGWRTSRRRVAPSARASSRSKRGWQGSRRVFAVLAGLAIGCAQAAEEVVLQGPTMGTYYRVRTIADSGEREAIRALIEHRLDAVDRAMSTYRVDSEISRFNRLAAGESQVLSEETWAVLGLAWQVREESRGAFDPTVGPLVDAWGFGAPGRSAEPTAPLDDQLAELRRAIGAIKLDSEDRRVLKLEDGAALDLSAIAKGWAVDSVSEALLKAGYTNHLVEVGGEIRTAGHSPAGAAWRIAIERPPARVSASGQGPETEEAAQPNLQRILPFTDGSLATSGDYRNYWERDGVRYSHTIDPRTGRPVEHAIASASVFHTSCAVADAYATALMALGADDGLQWADDKGIAALLLVYRDDTLEELPSRAFRDRFGAAD
ncbi:MAG: FAD:protein FMN transferase [Holophagales bacterium]|nr:FAD:protein FMN transferase [Holophagales bacterium]MYG30565.1 FAD:protein FMN transferase [Holophagales bacterium]MYI79086.1 FAD:protein FMN transferase [Holophagales bacterium]